MVLGAEIAIAIFAALIVAAYATLAWLAMKLVSIIINLIRTNENRLTVMEQAVQYTWRDVSEAKRLLKRLLELRAYTYNDPQMQMRVDEEAERSRPTLEREPDL